MQRSSGRLLGPWRPAVPGSRVGALRLQTPVVRPHVSPSKQRRPRGLSFAVRKPRERLCGPPVTVPDKGRGLRRRVLCSVSSRDRPRPRGPSSASLGRAAVSVLSTRYKPLFTWKRPVGSQGARTHPRWRAPGPSRSPRPPPSEGLFPCTSVPSHLKRNSPRISLWLPDLTFIFSESDEQLLKSNRTLKRSRDNV